MVARRSTRASSCIVVMLLGLLGLLAACGSARLRPSQRVKVAMRSDGVHATIDDEPFARLFASQKRPVIWPIYAPGGIAVTRAFPFANVPGESRDHEHHESFWFAHGDLNGVDFWTGIGHVEQEQLNLDEQSGSVRGIAKWVSGRGAEVCRDFHTITFSAGDDWRAIDIDVTLFASNGDLIIGDTKEGTFGIRLRPELALRGEGARGRIVNSDGLCDGAVWGRRADWVAYSARVDGQHITVAVFDHPDNHAHPTHWHARDYGLLAANPFGVHDFTGAPKGSGEVVLAAGGQLRLRYRLWIGTGLDRDREVDAAYSTWLAGG